MIVDLPQIRIMYLKSKKGISGATEAFNKLEAKLVSLKGRKFYGIILGLPPNEEYWASVALIDDNEAKRLELPMGEIPAGKYAQVKITNWTKNISQIGETFKILSKQNEVDASRPSVEFYRSMTDMIVRVPIK